MRAVFALLAAGALGQKYQFTFEVPTGSDLDSDGNSNRPADWAVECDSWKENRAPDAAKGDWDESAGWTCPEDDRSPSGCGDFKNDPRGADCTNYKYAKPGDCGDARWVHGTQEWHPQVHACNQHPIEYSDLVTSAGKSAPPNWGRHRERWIKWGEYEYLPTQRYLHASEHGGVIFLYHPCIDAETKCKLRQYIRDIENGRLENEDYRFPKSIQTGEGPVEEEGSEMGNTGRLDDFRWAMSPYKDLWVPFAMVAGTATYMSKCWNPQGMDEFLIAKYRRSWEDVSGDGAYDHLWIDYTKQDQCDLVENEYTLLTDDDGGSNDYTNLVVLVIVLAVLNFILLAVLSVPCMMGLCGAKKAEEDESGLTQTVAGGNSIQKL